jgi:hypothetical protein
MARKEITMRRFTILAATLQLAVATVTYAQSAPHFYKATSVRGAIAYQSAGDANQFFYIPTQTEALLGERLKEFRVSYYGIGEPFYIQNSETRKVESSVGAIMSATAIIDLSEDTRNRLIAQIRRDFKVETPRLAPLPLTDTKVRSLLLDSALSVSALGQIVSSSPQFAQEIRFSAGAKDNLFAQLLATSSSSGYAAVEPNPHFAVEIAGTAEFVGDSWKIDVRCDLAQVWKQVRAAVGVSASLGWFTLGSATYNSINQDLQRTGACSYTEVPGSLIDRDKNVLPLLEMTRRIFEQLNSEARGGQGFFKFEPNPEAPAVSAGASRSIWPWSVSVNAGYSSAHFNQSLIWTTRFEIGTRFNYPVAASTAVAVLCADATKKLFQDLRDTSENCITQRKIDRLMERLAKEKALVNRKLNDLEQRLIAGTVSTEVYDRLYKRWTTESQTEGSLQPFSHDLSSHGPGRDSTRQVSEGFAVSDPTSVDEDILWARQEIAKSRR